jgi:hypothetical protein
MRKDSTPGIMQRIHKQIRLIAFVPLVALLTLAAGCYGSFPLTRTIYQANGNVYGSVEGDRTQRKLAQSGVMWLFVPVYAVCGLGDMIVCNMIEFWTGNKMMETSYNDSVNGTRVELASLRHGQEAVLTVSRQGRVVLRERFIRTSPTTCEVRDGQGRLLGRIHKTAQGDLNVSDARGHLSRTLSAVELAALKKS